MVIPTHSISLLVVAILPPSIRSLLCVHVTISSNWHSKLAGLLLTFSIVPEMTFNLISNCHLGLSTRALYSLLSPRTNWYLSKMVVGIWLVSLSSPHKTLIKLTKSALNIDIHQDVWESCSSSRIFGDVWWLSPAMWCVWLPPLILIFWKNLPTWQKMFLNSSEIHL